MSVVGFAFSKILVEKKKTAKGKINISNNISIKEVKEAKLSFGQAKQKGLEFTFVFSSKYEPEIGNIELTGTVVYMDRPEMVKKVLETWSKNKQVPKGVLSDIYNTVLTKCNVQAIILSRDINLPPPIPFPKIKKGV